MIELSFGVLFTIELALRLYVFRLEFFKMKGPPSCADDCNYRDSLMCAAGDLAKRDPKRAPRTSIGHFGIRDGVKWIRKGFRKGQGWVGIHLDQVLA